MIEQVSESKNGSDGKDDESVNHCWIDYTVCGCVI